MSINQFEIWVADLNPQIGTEPAKTQPVLVIQSDLLNSVSHPSTIICPLTTNIQGQAEILRVHLEKDIANLHQPCDIMIDQIRSIDNKRLTHKIGVLPNAKIQSVKENVKIILDIDL